MGTIAEKLAYTKQAREEIRAAIVGKGVDCPGNAPFCSFDEYIEQISGGAQTESPITVFTAKTIEDFYTVVNSSEIQEVAT